MRVMLVEDDEAVRCVTVEMLHRLGHAVSEFGDPVPALAAFPAAEIDVVISDITMPGLDGFAFAEGILALRLERPPLVLLTTGYAGSKERLESYPPSAIIGLLIKPYGLADLASVLAMMGRMRERCPGMVAPLCPHVSASRTAAGKDMGQELCVSRGYTACAFYDSVCGRSLRRWVERHHTSSPVISPTP